MKKKDLSGWIFLLAFVCMLYNVYCIFMHPGWPDIMFRITSNIVLFFYMRDQWFNAFISLDNPNTTELDEHEKW